MPNVELWKCLPHQLPVRIAMVVQGVLRRLEMRQGRQLELWEVWSPVLSRKIVESHRVKLFVSVTGPSWDSKSFVPGECSSRYIFDDGAWTGLLRRIPWWVSPLSRKIWGTKWPINTLATTLQTMFSLRLDFALGSNEGHGMWNRLKKFANILKELRDARLRTIFCPLRLPFTTH